VTAGVVLAAILAAGSIPLAERAWKAGRWFNTIGLGLVFTCMAGYTLSASVERLGTYRDVKITSALAGNAKAGLAKEAYDEAVKIASSECTKRGARCRAAEEAVKRARESLSEKPVQGVADSMGARIIAVLPFLTPEQVQLYQPLTLPIGLQFGGFFLLALGLSPRPAEGGQTRRKRQNRKRGSQRRPAKKALGAANVVTFPEANNRAAK
jgi:hypothetical protein